MRNSCFVGFYWGWWALAGLLGGGVAEASEARLSGKVGNYTAFFTDPAENKVRHNRYELALKQVASYSFRLASTIEGRFRFDAAVSEHQQAPRRDYPKEVRANEMAEGELRQAYLDYLGDSFRLTAGIQLIDWVESLSVLANEMLTPVDLRHGGFGDAADLIRPVGAVNLNHKFIGGTLDWLVVPLWQHSQFPKGENGYGVYRRIRERLGDDVIIAEERTQYGVKDTEIGLRYLVRWGELEVTLLGYRGHRRTPVFLGQSIEEGRQFRVTMRYPMANTYGMFFTYAADALVLRLLLFYEPRRAQQEQDTLDGEVDDALYEKRQRAGLGLDYVFSRHFKFYSEHYYTRTERFPKEDDAVSDTNDDDDDDALWLLQTGFDDDGEDPLPNPSTDTTSVVRVTNESYRDVTFAVDGILSRPHEAHIVSPHIAFRFWDAYNLTVGARFIRSYAARSRFRTLSESSHAYMSLYRHF